ncbi:MULTISPECIES: hypothetical protein [Burkholderia]|uniref:hypothetical protein n=1 Tax=Burkholderia TaxID=32008 RepID=UPI000B1D4B16|nr:MULTISPECIES: hypothetical protein [unclassified Burkholderia]
MVRFSTDAGSDGGSEPSPDSGIASRPDPGFDSGLDSGLDSGCDSGFDSRVASGVETTGSPRTPAPLPSLPADDATAALPNAGALISVQGIARIVTLAPNEQARPSLWRRLMRWRECAGR